MRAPDFWGSKAGPGGRLMASALSPLSGVFSLAVLRASVPDPALAGGGAGDMHRQP